MSIVIEMPELDMTPQEFRDRNTLPGWHNDASTAMQWKRTWDVNHFDHPFHFILSLPESRGDKHFLPRLLVEAGFFASNGEVKKNRPDLWREVELPFEEEIKIGKWATIEIP